MVSRSKIALLAGMVAAASGTAAHAELTYTADIGAGYSDNITRVGQDEVSESMASAGLVLDWQERRPRFSADVSVDGDYVHYLDDTYDDDIVGGLDGTLDFKLLPDRLSWVVQDSFGQESIDPFSPVTPDTRENVNYFTTGPTLEFLVGRALTRVFATYSLTDFERTSFDSERVLGGLSIGRRSASGDGLAFNAVTENVKFKNDFNDDYDRASAYLSYDRAGARTEISAEVGYTWLELEDGTKSDDPRFSLEVTRELSTSSTLELTLGTQLTDSSNALRSDLGGGGTGTPGAGSGVTSSAAPYENRYASLAWQFNRHRTSLSLGTDWSDDTYDQTPEFDRERLNFNASIGRQISSRMSVSLQGNMSNEEFVTSGASVDTLELGAAMTWQLGPTLGLRFDFTRSDRQSSDGLGEYVENRAFLSLTYHSGPSRSPGSRAP